MNTARTKVRAKRRTSRTPSRRHPPHEVLECLRQCSVQAEDIKLAAHTDIDLLGNYRDHWLTVTDERLLVIADGALPSIELDVSLDQTRDYRAAMGVGSGLLQARIDSNYVDVLRYSSRGAQQFEKIARRLNRHLQGEPLETAAGQEPWAGPDAHAGSTTCATCDLPLETSGERCPHCISRGAVLLRMLKLMRPYRRPAIIMMSLLLVGIALDMVSPLLSRYLVDDVLVKATDHSRASALNMLVTVVMILMGVQIVRMTVNLLNGRLGSRIGTAITYDMRGRLVAHLQQLSIGYYDRQQVGSLVGRVAYDTESLHGFINQLTGGFLLQLLMVIGVGIMMFTIDPKLALFTLIPAPLVIAGTIVFWRHVYPRNYRAWDASSKQAGLLSGLLSGMRVVKAFNQEKREEERFSQTSRRLMKTQRSVELAMTTFNPIMGIVFQLGGWIVWYVGGRDVIDGRLSLGDLMAFFGYLWMFYGPLGTLPQFTNWLTNFATQAHRIFEILDTPVQIPEPANPQRVSPLRGDVQFENVSFGYHRHAPVVCDLNLEIQPGEFIGVVGHSGSGKSTLINLLCRFYDVNEGRVLVDGVDVRDVEKGELRSQIGVVLQEPFLFRGSIWDNIAYGKPDATPEQVIAASKAANCHDFIMRQQHGYDTWVEERGAGLSGGERQRIGIARVLLTDPRILILDEATSNIDSESEAAIQQALTEVARGRTTIAIAHRLSALRNADRVLVMDQGRIIESGTPSELIASDGHFAKLVKLQGAASSGESLDVANPLGGHHPRWLTSESANIHLGNHNALHVTVINERIYGGVFAVRCFPVHFPSEFISLRYVDGSGHEIEIGLLRSLDDWPTPTQKLVHDSLRKRYFMHTIRAINDIDLANNYLHCDVETDLGPQQFTMRWQADRAQEYGPRGKLLLDIDENRYVIPDVTELPGRERRLLERFIYW